ncbi:hypothetical protein K440DRAFT_95637 [Wilcoxina mikolae CBS 423.85]|nr:hypothetical protein K440DRAFT_95637 [Wilcoxina mikolae CBS 423.85]
MCRIGDTSDLIILQSVRFGECSCAPTCCSACLNMLSVLLRPKMHCHRPCSTYSSVVFDCPTDGRDCSETDDSSTSSKDGENSHLLPIFAADLDSIAVYSLVHWIRDEICANVDTNLSYEQLRTPQVSSFVVKPILSSMLRMEDNFSKAAYIYSLMANCLQFRKEMVENPTRMGALGTRALLCELLAIKLLKEFSTRELIDALSYDFYPLQGMPPPTILGQNHRYGASSTAVRASRISALELAIRAQAKKFLSHPMVTQHLEAIWAGNIVFHSHFAYDGMHRLRNDGQSLGGMFRRSAAIYDGSHAGLFKLSRLRVPRYRHIFSTFSLAILLLLHLMVLIKRSYAITLLEVTFWLWSFGFMMDEIADFNESGVALYFMSMWNAFDFSIFLLFMTFYALRIIGWFMPNDSVYITDWSYDILASCSIFLFPRIFSVLDHYRYFSQLIIAFRIMAADMVTLLIVIIVSCSGFFVAFTFSFAREYSSATDVSYSLFQILMGFTPAAWETWSNYNLLGKTILSAFLIITHFLIVTILITVLTNSFAMVAANSVEEHQFLVAVNTISMVKNEAIFTYLAPMNLIAWILHPFRWVLPFRKFVRLNRTVVKITHLPFLAAIYLYERTMLRSSVVVPTDAITNHHPGSQSTLTAFKTPNEVLNPAARSIRRKTSIASQQQEQVLEQVFAQPYRRGGTMQSDRSELDGKGSIVDSWMSNVLSASPPTENEGFVRGSRGHHRRDRGSNNRFGGIREQYSSMSQRLPVRDFSMTRSTRSDPEDFVGATAMSKEPMSENDLGADADNEANSIGGDEMTEESAHDIEPGQHKSPKVIPSMLRASTGTSSLVSPSGSSRGSKAGLNSSPLEERVASLPLRQRRRHHQRTESSNTILFNPIRRTTVCDDDDDDDAGITTQKTGHRTPGGGSSGKSRPQTATRPRPITNNFKKHFQPTSDLAVLQDGDQSIRMMMRTADVPSSFATQMAMATGGGDILLNRLVLAKIGALEQSMKEIKGILTGVSQSKNNDERDMRD